MAETETIFMHHPTEEHSEIGHGDKTYKPIDKHGTFEFPRESKAEFLDTGWAVGKHPKSRSESPSGVVETAQVCAITPEEPETRTLISREDLGTSTVSHYTVEPVSSKIDEKEKPTKKKGRR
jgi:hypothetical protein